MPMKVAFCCGKNELIEMNKWFCDLCGIEKPMRGGNIQVWAPQKSGNSRQELNWDLCSNCAKKVILNLKKSKKGLK